MYTRGRGERSNTVVPLVIMLASSVLADGLLSCRAKTCSHPTPSPVWQNPCGLRNRILARKRYLNLALENNEISPDGLRHPSTRPLRRVRTQLRIAYNHFRSGLLQRDIAVVYSGVKNLLKEEFEYDWLPGNQLAWYRDSIKCLDKKSKVEVLLPSLHSALQNFSATFEDLRRYGGESHHGEHQEIYYTRSHLLAEISHQVKKLLCEVETSILNVGLQLPSRLSAEAGYNMIWDVQPDHTGGLIQDWGVLAAYQTFLDDWLKIVRRLVGNKSNIPCKPRHKKKTTRKKLKPRR
ncbi:uncharacterized protein LOC128982704 [Macrosteles quadrilineatus]|uniref:uncharacterized protein LOC128982704 n=1 Tax=Macrosteles quadrilineatus TaxID=74068 RepID=UPI0023E1DCE0|nr:uncharacterized protein LOC128982704 [Macrosteles quadrilineatus]